MPRPTGDYTGSSPQGNFTLAPWNPWNSSFRQARLHISPWAMASSADLLLLGVVISQFYYYYLNNWHSDATPTRLLVLGVLCLACFKSALGISIVYTSEDILTLVQWASNAWGWMKLTSLFLTSFTGLLVHSWFLKRIIMVQRWPVGTITLLLMMGGIASTIVAVHFGSTGKVGIMRMSILANSCVAFMTNLCITMFIVSWWLPRRSQLLGLKESIYASLVYTTIPVTIMSLVALILISINVRDNGNDSYIVANFCLSKLYVICLLRILNSRLKSRSNNDQPLRPMSDFASTKNNHSEG
ncbi:hypothetical protein FRB91_012012 [Serendipita sp. 411]|nr:hypothetical protein FRC18_000081 [Serendipita sp. 400]KAG8856905.1 hypothetical protein FRB91_012012 [Serendipita sp. 411]